MRDQGHGDGRTRPLTSEGSLWAPMGIVFLLTAACVVWPAAVVVVRIVSGPREAGGGVAPAGVGLLASTFFYSGLIALLAVALAWPAAWVLRRGGALRIAIIGAPLLAPSYLAYAGWGILRGEGTWLGRVIATADPAWHAPTIAWRANAVIGLVLWVWPLAAFALAAALRRVPDDAFEMLRLDTRTRIQALRAKLGLARVGLIWALGLVLLVMLGSAVPLHVAQVRTWAIHVWTVLTTSEDRWRVWAAAWPLFIVAVVGAWLIGRRADRFESEAGQIATPQLRTSRTHAIATALLWILSVIVPIALFFWSIRTVRDPETGQVLQTRLERFGFLMSGFVRESADAIANSAANAVVVGAIGVLAGAGVWAAASGSHRRLHQAGHWCTRLLLVAGLVPGVLVGLAVHQAWDQPLVLRPIGDSPAIFVIAHLARFAFLGALVGWLLGRSEPAEQRDLRTLDGATGLAGWAWICLPRWWPVLAGAGLAMAALSLHEIEAAIWVQRPGEPFLARRMLNDLHYARDERLAVGAITMMTGGLTLGVAAAGLLGLAVRRRGRRADGGGLDAFNSQRRPR